MARTTQEVFDAHREAMETGDFEKLMADYADDAILVTLDEAYVGKEGVARFFGNAFESFPGLRISFEKTAAEGNLLLLQWSAECDVGTFPRGVAAFIIQDGKIQRQAEWFAFVPKEG